MEVRPSKIEIQKQKGSGLVYPNPRERTDFSPGPFSFLVDGEEMAKVQKCSISGCSGKYWAKGFCRSHYELNKRNGTPDYKRIHYQHCTVTNCFKLAHRRGYCSFHYHRFRKQIPFDLPRYTGRNITGSNNPRWNGGTSEYPNHSQMKKLRKEVLEEAGYICEKCGGRADRIHHRDFHKSHQVKANYMPICNGCNLKFHSKYTRLYGLTLQEMANKYGGSPNRYSLLELRGRLKDFLLFS